MLRAREQDHVAAVLTRREERNAEIARLTQVGLSPSEIAEQVGCCERTVFRARRAAEQQGAAA
ncbi:helix-turn-helix domain-containing protein [Streptomyces sp. NPDC013740]|uniref:helix-turn-helix domain-containing protein n=1 Tax=Streptomyces sp. NPDC013740 TaxID=3364867 RepID=UPI0036F77160